MLSGAMACPKKTGPGKVFDLGLNNIYVHVRVHSKYKSLGSPLIETVCCVRRSEYHFWSRGVWQPAETGLAGIAATPPERPRGLEAGIRQESCAVGTGCAPSANATKDP